MKFIQAQSTIRDFFGCDDKEISELSVAGVIEMAFMIHKGITGYIPRFSERINGRETQFIVEVGFDEGFYANVWDKESSIGAATAGLLESMGAEVDGLPDLIAWPFEVPTIEDLRSAIAKWADISTDVEEMLEAARTNSDWEPMPVSWYMPRAKTESPKNMEYEIVF